MSKFCNFFSLSSQTFFHTPLKNFNLSFFLFLTHLSGFLLLPIKAEFCFELVRELMSRSRHFFSSSSGPSSTNIISSKTLHNAIEIKYLQPVLWSFCDAYTTLKKVQKVFFSFFCAWYLSEPVCKHFKLFSSLINFGNCVQGLFCKTSVPFFNRLLVFFSAKCLPIFWFQT